MGRRTWTDDQLKHAVAIEKSWRGVLRVLGLSPTSGGSIGVVRRRAELLGLDISHFTGPRRWSDQQLRDAVLVSQSWDEVAGQLRLAKERRTALRLKGHAVRLGLDTSHLDRSPGEGPSIEALTRPADVAELRKAAPSIATAWFLLRGFPVAIPAEPQAYDLLVTAHDGLKRVQVKSTTCRTSNGRWQVGIGHRPYSLDSTVAKAPYDPSTLDLFAIINGDGEVYLIPMEAVAGRTGIYLSAYEKYRVGDVSGLLS